MKWRYGDYTTVFIKSFETDSSYAYHHLNEMIEHWTLKKERALQPTEINALKEKIVLDAGHL
jgi:hypothetical protein